MKIGYGYHLVTVSPWPFTTSISAMSIMLGNVLLMNNKFYGSELSLGGFLGLLISLTFWFQDIVYEGTYKGDHTKVVQKGLNLGFTLFVVSEICVFFSLFFAYFFSALVPSVETGSFWPPVGILAIDYKSVPLFNTLILLSSGFALTASHNFMLTGIHFNTCLYLVITIALGLLFSLLQGFEYYYASFTLADSVYGSSFFILTGCHALHIFVGSGLLLVSLIRLFLSHFSIPHHLLFSFSAIYWHFVDAVWLLLFFVIYVYT